MKVSVSAPPIAEIAPEIIGGESTWLMSRVIVHVETCLLRLRCYTLIEMGVTVDELGGLIPRHRITICIPSPNDRHDFVRRNRVTKVAIRIFTIVVKMVPVFIADRVFLRLILVEEIVLYLALNRVLTDTTGSHTIVRLQSLV